MRGLPSLLYARQVAEARRLRTDAIAALFRRLPFRRPHAGTATDANNNGRGAVA